MARKPPSFGTQFRRYVTVVLVFAVQPLIAVRATNYARKSFDETFEEIRKKAFELMKNDPGFHVGDVTISGKDMLEMAGGPDAIPELKNLDSYCDATSDESIKETVCQTYHDVKVGQISAVVGAASAPIVPVLMTMAAAAAKMKQRKKRNLRSGLSAWILLKGLNKVIALEAAPFGLAVGFACLVLGLGDFWATCVGLLVAGIFFGLKRAVVESYTDGVLTVEMEFEPPEHAPSAAA
jgi:hypothetical protein